MVKGHYHAKSRELEPRIGQETPPAFAGECNRLHRDTRDTQSCIRGNAPHYATYHGNSPMTFAAGLGHGITDHAAVEGFYASRNVPVIVRVNDHTDRHFIDLLEARGYARVGEIHTWIRDIGFYPQVERPAKITVRVADKTDADIWVQTVARGAVTDNSSSTSIDTATADTFYSLGFSPRTMAFLAFEGHQPTAGAVLVSAYGIAILATACTLPQHRQKGAQSALIAARLERARELGCTVALTNTNDREEPSARNLVRFGFESMRKSQIYKRSTSVFPLIPIT
jgi:GNAT superfamily N-acetyltransferase